MPNSKLVASMYEQVEGSSSLPASQLRRDILLLSSVCSHWIIHKGEEDTVRLLGHYHRNEKKGDCFKVSTGKVEALIIHGSWAACCNIVVPLKNGWARKQINWITDPNLLTSQVQNPKSGAEAV